MIESVFLLAWFATGLVIWLMTVMPARCVTVGDAISLPLFLLAGPVFGLIWGVVIITDAFPHVIIEWSKRRD